MAGVATLVVVFTPVRPSTTVSVGISATHPIAARAEAARRVAAMTGSLKAVDRD
jgi:hypothetical protein